jgi:hypothetical protein
VTSAAAQRREALYLWTSISSSSDLLGPNIHMNLPAPVDAIMAAARANTARAPYTIRMNSNTAIPFNLQLSP